MVRARALRRWRSSSRAGRAEAPQRHHLHRRRPAARFGQSDRHARAVPGPHRRRVLRQQPRRVSDTDDAERGGDCDGTLSRATRGSSPTRSSSAIRCSRPAASASRPARWCLMSKTRSCSPIINHQFGGNYMREASLSRLRGRTATTRPPSEKRGPLRHRICRKPRRCGERCAIRSPSFSTARQARRAPCR